MQTVNPPRVVGVFEDQRHAVEATRDLLKAGFPADRMVLVARDWRQRDLDELGIEIQHAADEGALAGAAVGGTVGAAAGLLTLLIPGIGGPVAVALIALAGGIGASTGAIVGPFIAMEMTEAEAHEHAAHVRQGRTVLVLRDGSRLEEAQSIMVHHGAYDLSMHTD